jgi:hypothetical protein
MLANRKPVSILWIVPLGLLLSSCASTPPADLEKLVRVFNVHRAGGEALPREIEGCEPLGVVVASAPAPEAANVTTLTDPTGLVETIRARAHRKGADTAFVFIATGVVSNPSRPGGPLSTVTVSDGNSLRATIFRCGDSPGPQALGSPIR